ncbi:MAG: amidohydrolase family protein [Thermoplasmata archaeon]|nr:amidohydrolase family protein [Thermoplasmata archaeon]MCI4360000.1 amidohydrolase family protein [Thermoplasmata archaeon]
MGVTDCHVHINPVWEMLPRARAILGTRGPGVEVEAYDRSPQRFLAYLDRCGVERAVLINYVAPEIVGYTEKANDFAIEYARTEPERLIPVGSVLPTHAQPGREVERLAGAGLRGIKLHPPHQLFRPNDYLGASGGLGAIYEAAQRLKLPVVFHTGTSIFPGARNRFGEPLLIEDVAIDYPDLLIVLAHGGRPLWMQQARFLVRRFPNVFLEISSIPPPRLLEYFPDLERLAPQVLFGSDWPGPGVEDIGQNLAAFRALPIAAEAKERILNVNPESVFPRS